MLPQGFIDRDLPDRIPQVRPYLFQLPLLILHRGKGRQLLRLHSGRVRNQHQIDRQLQVPACELPDGIEAGPGRFSQFLRLLVQAAVLSQKHPAGFLFSKHPVRSRAQADPAVPEDKLIRLPGLEAFHKPPVRHGGQLNVRPLLQHPVLRLGKFPVRGSQVQNPKAQEQQHKADAKNLIALPP